LAEVVVPLDLERLFMVPLVLLSMVWRIVLCEKSVSGFDDGVHTVLLVYGSAHRFGEFGLGVMVWGVTDWALDI
jgi:peptidoglycan/LPS O-acetylase OafA/YrhL